MAAIEDWYSRSLRPRLRRAVSRGHVPQVKLHRLDDLMAGVIASERLVRAPVPPGRPVPPPRRRA